MRQDAKEWTLKSKGENVAVMSKDNLLDHSLFSNERKIMWRFKIGEAFKGWLKKTTLTVH